MDFSSLPDNVFLQIFHFLPFRDQIRIGGVSAAFRRMSDIAISETKSLDLHEVALREVSPLCFMRLLDLCQGGLKKCKLVGSLGRGTQYEYHQAMADAFNQYTYPQLNTLSFDSSYDSIIDSSLRKYAINLESLSVDHVINFPDVIMERLQTLAILACDDRTVQSLAGKVPNLRRLMVTDYGLSTRALDGFLGTVPRLESFSILMSKLGDARPLDLEGNSMTAFWQLHLLNQFEVSYFYLGHVGVTNALMRIAQSFPRLRVLSLYNVESGNNAVAALSSLQDLRVLELKEVRKNINVGLRELARCELLEQLVVTYLWVDDLDRVTADTVSTLLRSCPRLTFVACRQFVGINTAEDAVAFIASLVGLEKSVTLGFDGRESPMRLIWESTEVKDALKKLDEEAGVVVKIFYGNFD